MNPADEALCRGGAGYISILSLRLAQGKPQQKGWLISHPQLVSLQNPIDKMEGLSQGNYVVILDAAQFRANFRFQIVLLLDSARSLENQNHQP